MVNGGLLNYDLLNLELFLYSVSNSHNMSISILKRTLKRMYQFSQCYVRTMGGWWLVSGMGGGDDGFFLSSSSGEGGQELRVWSRVG